MRVKIGDVWYSTDDQPICVQLSPTEQEQVAAMPPQALPEQHGKYGVFPDDWEPDQMFEWMAG